MTHDITLVDARRLAEQAAHILRAWGRPPDEVQATVDGLAYADRHGIDSHGVAMLPVYERWRAQGRFHPAPQVRVLLDEGGPTALIDGDGAFGYLPATRAMALAIEKTQRHGLAAVAVRRSTHFGAAGHYVAMAAEHGLMAMATTNTEAASVIPAGGRDARFGTNPIAFAAPSARGQPFLLDMATSTVALGKLMVHAYRGERIPHGWAVDPDGRDTDDPRIGYDARRATPLGGTAQMSYHKGSGLAMMVELLSATLPGAQPADALRDPTHPAAPGAGGVGHFFLVLDPRRWRGGEAADREPGADVDAMVDQVRRTPPLDPAHPVQVAGDPERAQRAQREREGVPLPMALVEALRGVAGRAGARWTLT